MILIVDVNGEKESLSSYEFCEPIASIAERYGKTRVVHFKEVTGKDLRDSEKVIITGTPLMESGYLQSIERFDWLRDFERPVLGICAGMQIIGLAFGSKLIQSKEIGMTELEALKDNPMVSSGMKVYSLHTKAVIPSDEFEVLGRSSECVQAMRHKEKPIYGMLFHPEARNVTVVERFIKGEWH